MLEFNQVDKYLNDKGAISSQPFDDDLLAYSLDATRIAYVGRNSRPLRLSLRCNPGLAKSLISEYESVMPGHKLDPKKWITILDTGQLEEQQIFDLIDHAFLESQSVNN
ncbi:MmcQ/YjbR family DNA-binding protein [Candidatus Saccharibacteria bacterium]|nr:MmcQ/YjbR family DNA-binding protein [Candidatus Saccharibacteria bacterium]MBP9131796.1 MmcQ/YjbR family DNA-binding protein [Candidatus Saccharibacteria bacterium]